MGLQQFGVIPFEIRTLKTGHTEQRRTRRFYIAAIVRHRGTVGAWRNRGYLRVFINVFVYFITKQQFARFLKTFIHLLPKLSATRTLRLCRSLCLRHLCDIVCFTSVFSPSLCAFYIQQAYFITPYFGRTKCIFLIIMVLFLNIFYVLIGILSIFVT